MSKLKIKVQITEEVEETLFTSKRTLPVFELFSGADTVQEARAVIDEHLSILAPDNLVKYTRENGTREIHD